MQFGLPSPNAEPDVPVPSGLEVSTAVASQIQSFLPIYLQLSEALAADQLDAAKSAVNQLHEQIADFGNLVEDSEAAKLWREERRDLSEIAGRLSKASDLEAMRMAFALLSESMISIERTFGAAEQQDLYLLHCPMAFDGRGASWLQTEDAVRNPYYGASMLKCADKVEQL